MDLSQPVQFLTMAKPIGPICNLNCTYCYYLEKTKLYQNQTNFRMKDDVLEEYIKKYIASQQTPVVNFVWQGGEPTLLGVDYFKKIVRLQQKYAEGREILNSLQTNGTLLDHEWGLFLRDNNFLIGCSIDGPEEFHDKYRIYRQNEHSSFTDVMRGIEILHKYGIEFNTLTVIHRDNALHPTEVYRFLKEIGSGFIQFLPVVERTAPPDDETELKLVHNEYRKDAKVTEWSVIPEDYGHFLIKIFNEWIQNDVGKIFVQIFDVALSNWVGAKPYLCDFSEECETTVIVEHNGDLFSCDHFVYPEYKLGNIMKDDLIAIAASPQQTSFVKRKRHTLPGQCLECDYLFACHGECPKKRFAYTSKGEYGLNYLCKAYKLFFKHINPFMQFMKNQLLEQRPPADAMLWIESLDPISRQGLFGSVQ